MSKYLVGLDDGHGINTAGKRTVELKESIKFNGKTRKKGTIIHENEFNEVIMRKVEPILKRCGIDYVELAPTDSDTPLSTRANTANGKGCDLVVSIHANALYGTKWQTKAYGLVVIKTRGCQSKTDKLAKIMYKHLKEVDFPSDGETKYGVRVDTEISGFTLAILRQTKMPAVLVELGFMDNWSDVKVMCTEKFQDECAEGIAKAICEYLDVKYVAKKGEFKPYYVKVVSNSLNGREGAGTSYDIVQKLKKDEVVTILEEKILSNGAKWGRTKYYWINIGSKYVEFVRNV